MTRPSASDVVFAALYIASVLALLVTALRVAGCLDGSAAAP